MIINIGVFDSGIGGEAVAQSLRNNFSEVNIVCISDKDNMRLRNTQNLRD
jgi:glutamate racemase